MHLVATAALTRPSPNSLCNQHLLSLKLLLSNSSLGRCKDFCVASFPARQDPKSSVLEEHEEYWGNSYAIWVTQWEALSPSARSLLCWCFSWWLLPMHDRRPRHSLAMPQASCHLQQDVEEPGNKSQYLVGRSAEKGKKDFILPCQLSTIGAA